jgi:DNA-directed RNA polymerase subunit RPC12/RpoP
MSSVMLEIGRRWTEEHEAEPKSTFKCLACYERFSQYLVAIARWCWCPHCGQSIQLKGRIIPEKKYLDSFGYGLKLGGQWVQLKAPHVNLEISIDPILNQEFKMEVFGDHRHLKHTLQLERWHHPQLKWRIKRSAPLPLP